jgi:hypothetical protein
LCIDKLAGWLRFEFRHGSTTLRLPLGSIQIPIQWESGTISPEVNRQEREADHSAASSAEDKMSELNLDPLHVHDVVLI